MFIKKGFNDFIAKPIDVEMLDKVLYRWIPDEYIAEMDVIEGPLTAIDSNGQGNMADIGCDTSMEQDEHINMEVGLRYAGDGKELYMDIL